MLYEDINKSCLTAVLSVASTTMNLKYSHDTKYCTTLARHHTYNELQQETWVDQCLGSNVGLPVVLSRVDREAVHYVGDTHAHRRVINEVPKHRDVPCDPQHHRSLQTPHQCLGVAIVLVLIE